MPLGKWLGKFFGESNIMVDATSTKEYVSWTGGGAVNKMCNRDYIAAIPALLLTLHNHQPNASHCVDRIKPKDSRELL